VAVEAVEKLIEGIAAETSWIGIGLTAGTLVLCPVLGVAKQRIARNSNPEPHTAKERRTSCARFSQVRCWLGWQRIT
jgi:hypothetical protein